MTRWLSLGFLVLSASVLSGASCGSICPVTRDANVYQTELDFLEQAALQPVESLSGFVGKFCKCAEGKFTTDECHQAAKHVVTVRARVSWHKQMALFNGGLVKERPSQDPPDIPAAETLCPKEP